MNYKSDTRTRHWKKYPIAIIESGLHFWSMVNLSYERGVEHKKIANSLHKYSEMNNSLQNQHCV